MTRRPATPRKRLTATTPTLLAVITLTVACAYDEGPPGRVIDKNFEHTPNSGSSQYTLTVRTTTGEDVTFTVPSLDYHDCYHGSAYPACTKRDHT